MFQFTFLLLYLMSPSVHTKPLFSTHTGSTYVPSCAGRRELLAPGTAAWHYFSDKDASVITV